MPTEPAHRRSALARRLTARLLPLALGALALGSCHDSVTGPSAGMSFVDAQELADSVFAGAPGDFASARPSVRLVDGAGHAVAAATLRWTVIGDGAEVTRFSERTTSNGEASADWRFGTNAAQPQQLLIEAKKGGARAMIVLHGSAQPKQPEILRLSADTTTVDLGAPAALSVVATDRFGNDFAPPGVSYRVVVGAAVEIGSDGRPMGVARGTSRVEARLDSLADTTVVNVIQRVATIGTSGSTRLNAIGSTIVVRTLLVDVNGRAVLDSAAATAVADTSIARVTQRGDSILITSVRAGLTTLTLTVGSVRDRVPILVSPIVAAVTHTPASLAFASLGDSASVVARATDSAGVEVASAHLTLAPRDPAVVGVDAAGVVRALANGQTQLVISVDGVVRDSLPVTVRQQPVAITVAEDTLTFSALGASVPLSAQARDAAGRVIADQVVAATVSDTTVARVVGAGILAVRNGTTSLVLTAGAVQRVAAIEVAQRATRIVPTVASIELTALGARAAIGASAVDSLGSAVPGTVTVAIVDSTVARLAGADSVEAAAPGTTALTLNAAGLSTSIPVTVWQKPARIILDESVFAQPLAVAPNARLAAGASVVDANAHPIAGAPVSVVVDEPTVGSTGVRDTIIVIGSGVTTVRVRSGALEESRSLRVYLPPQLAQRRIAATFDADTALGNPWAPTLTMAPDGNVRLYFAAYKMDPSVNFSRADLAYLTSSDTSNFHYAGTAIPHQPATTDRYGWGLENVVVVPRRDAPGMRMYFSGGSQTTGWQVFSAIGDGVGRWFVEAGIRVSNGALHLYPQGEGMVVLPDAGGQRMVLGSMQLASGQANSWAIVEFRSADGLQWDYSGEVLRPGVPGSGTERAVYSPSIVPFGKGAWRMFYTGDDIGRVPTGGKSQMWSAVSFDLKTWSVEGVILPAVDGNIYYASALGDKVAYIRTPAGGGVNKIEIAQMVQH
ncbi:MAG: hypothetical protein ACJ79K_03865 [Gemmatimonadaceae bacterium]